MANIREHHDGVTPGHTGLAIIVMRDKCHESLAM
jgi:hypothetical protein